MKILIVTQYFWPENFCINEIAASLVGRGHTVEALTGIPNYPGGRFFDGYGWFKGSREEHCGIDIRRVPLVPRGAGGSARLFLNYLSFVFFSCLLAPWRCRKRYDVIFVYEPSPITVCLPALLLKWLRSIPVVFWVQDLWPESISATGAFRSRLVLDLVGRLVRFIYRRCDRILVQSEAFRDSVERMGADKCAVEYYPNCADSSYRPLVLEADAPERTEVPAGFKIMFAGNVGAAQDFGTILDTAELLREHQDIRWVILGDGRQSAWLEEQVQMRGLSGSVFLLGRRPAAAMPRYFALADVMLLTLRKSPIFALTVPSKLQAYLACGKAVVAALDGEGARIVKEARAGLTCPAEQPELLAERIQRIYEMNAEDRLAMGKRGREYYEQHFDKEALLDRLEGIMKDVVARADRSSDVQRGKCVSEVRIPVPDARKTE